MIIEELITVLGFRESGTAAAAAYQSRLKGISTALGGLTAAATRAVAVLGTLGVSIGGIALVRGLVTTGMQFEKFQAILETVEGTSEKAKQSLEWVTAFATRTPYDVAQVTQAFVRMRAYGLDPTSGLLESVGNAGAAMGKNIMDGTEAVADAVTGEFERLKEFGVRASTAGDQVTFSWQQNGETLSKTVKKQGDEIAKALQEIFSKYAGAMDKQSKTFEGILSNIGDKWTNFQRKINDAGFFNEVKRRFQSLLDTFDRMDRDGTLDRWAKNISDSLIKIMQVGDTIVWAFTRAGKAVAFLGQKISEITGLSFGTLLGAGGFALLARRHPVVAFMLAVIAVLDDLRVYLSGEGKSVIGMLMEQFQGFAEEFPRLAAMISEVGSALFYLAAGALAVKAAVVGIRTAGAALAAVFGGLGVGSAAATGAAVATGAGVGAGAAAGAAGGGATAAAATGAGAAAAWGARLKMLGGIAGRLSLWITAAMIAARASDRMAAAWEKLKDGDIFGGLGSGGKGGALDQFLYGIGESANKVLGEMVSGFFSLFGQGGTDADLLRQQEAQAIRDLQQAGILPRLGAGYEPEPSGSSSGEYMDQPGDYSSEAERRRILGLDTRMDTAAMTAAVEQPTSAPAFIQQVTNFFSSTFQSFAERLAAVQTPVDPAVSARVAEIARMGDLVRSIERTREVQGDFGMVGYPVPTPDVIQQREAEGVHPYTGLSSDQLASGMTMIAQATASIQGLIAQLPAALSAAFSSLSGMISGPMQMLGGAIGVTAAAPAPNVTNVRNVSVSVSAPVSIVMNGTAATPGAVAGAVSGAIGGAADRAADILASEPSADASPAAGAAGAAS